jgi:cytochrome c peroxidase
MSLSRFLCAALAGLLWVGIPAAAQNPEPDRQALEALGRALFFDTAFSASRNQSCASCHDPAAAFTDARNRPGLAPVSVGSNGRSLGSRNVPGLGYVGLTPAFGRDDDGVYAGGFFLDGRAPDLAAQAAVPLLHPDEMAMADEEAVRERLLENPDYVQAFESLFGAPALRDGAAAVRHFSEAIAAFEGSEYFAPFDSRYDRYLRGEYQPTVQEQVGMALFFTPGFTSCNQCHQLRSLPNAAGETFSNYRYENIGVPPNPLLASSGAVPADWVDEGLAANPWVVDRDGNRAMEQRGRFKVPGLRNVALTAPYMHNGVFRDLRTVLQFYNKFNAFTESARINSETGQPWAAAEVDATVAHDKLRSLFLTEPQIDALLAFLRMLTDQRYEHLLN